MSNHVWQEEKLMTAQEVADWIRVHVKTVYRWIQSGELEAVRFGTRTYRVRESVFKQFLKQKGIE